MDMIIIKYIHFVGVIFFSATIFFEFFLLKERMPFSEFKKVCQVDIFYGFSALVVLTAGLILWFIVGKESSFFTQNYLFHIKLTVFILVGLLSIYPTMFFIKNRHANCEIVEIPKMVLILVKLEFLLLLVLPLLAVLVVNGYGY